MKTDTEFDYVPNAGKVTTDKTVEGEWTKEANLRKLEKCGISHTLVDKGDVAVFRSPGRATVDFFTRKNRWLVRGHKKTTFGTFEQFVSWYRSQYGVPV